MKNNILIVGNTPPLNLSPGEELLERYKLVSDGLSARGYVAYWCYDRYTWKYINAFTPILKVMLPQTVDHRKAQFLASVSLFDQVYFMKGYEFSALSRAVYHIAVALGLQKIHEGMAGDPLLEEVDYKLDKYFEE